MDEPVDLQATWTESADPRPVTVRLHVGPDGLRALREDGREHHIPFEELSVEAGGFEQAFVFCKSREGGPQLTVADARLLPAIAHFGGEIGARAVASIGVTRKKGARGRSLEAGLAVLVIAVIALFLWNVPALVANFIGLVPTAVDRQLGDLGEMAVEGETEVTAPAVRGLVDEIVTRLGADARREGFELRPMVVDSPEVNAFALPGGRIVVYTGLLRKARSADEVAGVLAHEIAHVTLRHGMTALAHRAGLVLAVQLVLGDVSALAAVAADMATDARSNAYSRESEDEADEVGVRTMSAAGLDPNGLAGFFRVLQSEQGSELPGMLTWLGTHPEHAARIAHVEAIVRTLPPVPRRPLTSDFAAMQAALPPAQ